MAQPETTLTLRFVGSVEEVELHLLAEWSDADLDHRLAYGGVVGIACTSRTGKGYTQYVNFDYVTTARVAPYEPPRKGGASF